MEWLHVIEIKPPEVLNILFKDLPCSCRRSLRLGNVLLRPVLAMKSAYIKKGVLKH